MRRTTGIPLTAILAAALGIWMWSWFTDVKSTAPGVKASIIPLELMQKADKNLPDQTPREPF
jgi:hypothetical protein